MKPALAARDPRVTRPPMPKLNDPRDRSSNDSTMPEESPEWAIRVGRFGGLTLSISFTVFLAGAGLVASLTALGSRGDGGIASAAGVGVAIWVGGWAIQIVVTLLSALVLGLRMRALTLSLIGVEMRPHVWRPERCVGWAIAMIGGLVLSGAAVWWLAGGVSRDPTVRPWHVPSLGLGQVDAVGHAAAWLLWIQAACQCVPLPGTAGRFAMLSVIAIGAREADTRFRIGLARRLVRGTAIVIAFIAIGLIPTEFGGRVPRWILLILLAAALWISSRSRDLVDLSDGFAGATLGGEGLDETKSLADRVRGQILAQRRRRRLVATAREEHQEATDAARLDEILERLRVDGVDALSDDERGVLRRVSDRLRRIREASSPESGTDQ